MKKLITLSYRVAENEYRNNPALSYTTIARYEKGGFSSIPHLYDNHDSPAITFGSAVDTLITEGAEAFSNKFAVASFTIPTDAIKLIIDNLLDKVEDNTLEEVDDSIIIEVCNELEYQVRWKDETRINKVRELGLEYFNTIRQIGNRKVISNDLYQEILATVGALKTNPQTAKYLQNTNNDEIEFLYQPKFTTTLDGLDVRCMFDLLIVSYEKKLIIPIDLKTTSMMEYDFPKKYLENRYDIQSRLYYRILRNILDLDEYFKDFTIANFKFMVINKNSRLPIIFIDDKCKEIGDIEITFKNGRKSILRDPITIGKELNHLLTTEASLPEGIDVSGTNLYERIKLL